MLALQSSYTEFSRARPLCGFISLCQEYLDYIQVLPIVQFHHVLWGGETSCAIKLENMAEATKLGSRLRRKLNIRNYLSLLLKKAKNWKKMFL